MRFPYWLTKVYSRLNHPTLRAGVQRQVRSTQVGSMLIEQLEPRQLLSGAPVPVGVETLVNPTASIDQIQSNVAMDPAGDHVVVWGNVRQGYNSQFHETYAVYEVYAQRYNAAGAAQGTAILVGGDSDKGPSVSVAMDDQGAFVVAWNGMARMYNAAGVALDSAFEVYTGLSAETPATSVAMDPAGDFVVTGVAYHPYSNTGNEVWAQRYNSSGVAQGANFEVSSINRVGSLTMLPSVAMDHSGDFVIAYSDSNGPGNVFVNRYNSSGMLQGTVQANTNSNAGVSRGSRGVAMDAAGDFVVTWQSYYYNSGSQNGIYAQRYNAAGTAQGANVQVDQSAGFRGYPGIISAPVSMDSAGDFAIAWTIEPDGNGPGVAAQTFNAAGVAQETPFTVNTYTTGIQCSPGLGMDSAGDFVVAWNSDGQNVPQYRWNVYSQLYATPTNTGTQSLSGLRASGYYVQGTAPLAIAPNLVVTEPNGVDVTSATVSFTNWQAGDRVSFSNSLSLQHTFTENLSAHTATLTITGGDTAADYQTLLQSVVFSNVAGQPNTSATRVATITIHDSQTSASAMENLNVFQYLAGLSATVNYLQGSTPLSIAPSLVVTLPSGLSIESATVSFANWQAEDRLSFSNSLGLQHAFNQDLTAHTATLTITGMATGAGYQSLLRSVTYQDVAGNPNTSTRAARITVNDGTNSPSATENVTITAADKPPLVQVHDSTALTYKVNNPAIAIMSMALVSDPDSHNLSNLTVQITSGYQNNSSGHDILSFVNEFGITGAFDASIGKLTLSGVSYVGNYREVLRLVKFQTTGSAVSTATRTFTVIATDDSGQSNIPMTRNMTVTP